MDKGGKKCSWYMQGKEDSIVDGVTRAGDQGKRCCLPKASCCVSTEGCWLSSAGVGRKDGYQEKNCSGGGDRRICELKVSYIHCLIEENGGKIPRMKGKIPPSL